MVTVASTPRFLTSEYGIATESMAKGIEDFATSQSETLPRRMPLAMKTVVQARRKMMARVVAEKARLHRAESATYVDSTFALASEMLRSSTASTATPKDVSSSEFPPGPTTVRPIGEYHWSATTMATEASAWIAK